MQYTSILRADPTCLLAVARASGPHFTPLLVFDNEDIAQVAVRAARLRFNDMTVGVDLRSERRAQLLASPGVVLEPLARSGARCRPVITLKDDPAALRAIGAWAEANDAGLWLRIRIAMPGARERLQQAMVLASAGTRRPKDTIHVLLDQTDDLSTWACDELVPMLADQGPWGSITVAAGSAPAMSGIATRGAWIRAERRELAIAHHLQSLGRLSSPLGLGDYANRHPILEANLTHARGNGLRCSTNDGWMIMREQSSTPSPPNEHRREAFRELVSRDLLRTTGGRSWGERSIAKFLNGRAEADQINAWLLNHHLELAARTVIPPVAVAATAAV